MNVNKIFIGGALLAAFGLPGMRPAAAQIPIVQTSAAGAPVKVACVGDSITAGVGASADQRNYPSLLGDLLGPKYNVVNFGESGATLLKNGDSPYWQRGSYARSAAFGPNIVVILLGTNDSKPQNWAKKSEFAADYAALLDYYAALPTHPKLFACLPTPVPHPNYGINEPAVDEELPIIREVALQKGATIIDVHSLMPDDNADFVDGVHPSNGGYVLLTSAIYQGMTHAPVILPIADRKFYSSLTVTLTPPTPDAAMRYTVNGTAPTRSSALYKGPLVLTRPTTLKAQAFQGKSPLGLVSTATFSALVPLPAQTVAVTDPGLSYAYYEAAFQNTSDFSGQTPVSTGTIADFSLTPRKRDLNFGLKYDGYVDVPTTGLYTFSTNSDDGTSLDIDGQTVIASNGPHGATAASGQIALAAGKHRLTLLYFQDGGDFSLSVTWQGPGISTQDIPASALSHAHS
jgi:acyl-CoA thioesterase-1